MSISLSVNPCNLQEAIHHISYAPDSKEQDESHPHFIFHCKLLLNLPYISKLINLNYFFRSSLKPIKIGTKSQFHNGIHLEILLIFILVFLRHIKYCQRKSFYKDEFGKINELSNFKCILPSHINKIRDTTIELGSRDPLQDLEFSPKQPW